MDAEWALKTKWSGRTPMCLTWARWQDQWLTWEPGYWGGFGVMTSSRQLHTWAWSSGALGWNGNSEEQQQSPGIMPRVHIISPALSPMACAGCLWVPHTSPTLCNVVSQQLREKGITIPCYWGSEVFSNLPRSCDWYLAKLGVRSRAPGVRAAQVTALYSHSSHKDSN